jgi:hypothetical protein
VTLTGALVGAAEVVVLGGAVVVSAEVVVFASAVVVGLNELAVTAGRGTRPGAGMLEVADETSGIGGARELGGARGIGGASGFVVATATCAPGMGCPVDGEGFTVVLAGCPMTMVGTGADATMAGGRGAFVGDGAESTGSFTAVCPGGTEITERVTLGKVGTGAVTAGSAETGVVGTGDDGTGAMATGAAGDAGTGLATTEPGETGGTGNPVDGEGFGEGAAAGLTGGTDGTNGVATAGLFAEDPATERGGATIAGAVSWPTPTRGIAGPAPAAAPATTTPELSTGTAEFGGFGVFAGTTGRAGMAGSEAPAWIGATGTGVVGETGGSAGVIGAALGDGRSRA